ncbi:MAG: RNA 2',3'-cyclic phosphodiesterase [Proteobacteria bacterium]|nr:RNA 2',3'-cyclic phosphodiesterase [Pseudomonadota bacterium]
MVRLFVAIDLPAQVRARLGGLGAGVPGARWVDPEQIHLTLRFIGEVDGAAFEDVRLALSAVRAPRFEVMLEGVGHFGDRRRVRALWAGVAPGAALNRLAGQIEAALVGAGLEPEGRKFKAHVTLARLRGAPVSRVADFLAGNALFQAGPIAVDRFQLYSSRLSQSGPSYRVEASYELMETHQTPNLLSVDSTRLT